MVRAWDGRPPALRGRGGRCGHAWGAASCLSRSRPQTRSWNHGPETPCLGLLGFSSS